MLDGIIEVFLYPIRKSVIDGKQVRIASQHVALLYCYVAAVLRPFVNRLRIDANEM